jgi:hypothetical protein
MTPQHGGVGIRRQGDSERGRLRTSDCAPQGLEPIPGMEFGARLNVAAPFRCELSRWAFSRVPPICHKSENLVLLCHLCHVHFEAGLRQQ